jgi:hypothetical protein
MINLRIGPAPFGDEESKAVGFVFPPVDLNDKIAMSVYRARHIAGTGATPPRHSPKELPGRGVVG